MPKENNQTLEQTLWKAADKLRNNLDAAEYKHVVLGLIFLKYISDSFASRRAELERKLTDESDDYYLGDDDPELLAAEAAACLGEIEREIEPATGIPSGQAAFISRPGSEVPRVACSASLPARSLSPSISFSACQRRLASGT